MKMKIGTALPADYVVSHEDLTDAATTLIAQTLLPLFAESMSEEVARANVQGIVTELAYLFDEGAIEIGGKSYMPRLAFVDEQGAILPGVAALTTMHECVEDLFDIDPAAQITFEEPEYDE
ncbi:hypothetical protein SAMN04488005_1887 [Yoonia tamlensis]|uniref:Uncharacterized protein n=1 Tax=Yoonia tamlensis TaxID=390270 RepID=A0A1I6GM52_9RHOB|nr:hypothetical protein [Yoonia tamlensis]SFR43293.1 hypothetical protein SAMN04488005_1887 [Yoonia tamlensis]